MAKKSMINKQQKTPKFSTRAYNRCKICGRPHAYLRKYGICRICFRELAYKGQITGYQRAPPGFQTGPADLFQLRGYAQGHEGLRRRHRFHFQRRYD